MISVTLRTLFMFCLEDDTIWGRLTWRERKLVNCSNAGCITYVGLPSSIKYIRGTWNYCWIIQWIMISIFLWNVLMYCEDCGYCGDNDDTLFVVVHLSSLRRVMDIQVTIVNILIQATRKNQLIGLKHIKVLNYVVVVNSHHI